MVTGNHSVKQLKPYQWKPGQSGNPSGRPKDIPSPTAELHRIFRKDPNKLVMVVNALWKLACSGNIQAIQEIFVRTDGRVVERHELDTRLPVTIVFQAMPTRHVDALETPQNENLDVIEGQAVELPMPATETDKDAEDLDSTAANGSDEAESEQMFDGQDTNDMPLVPNPAALHGCIKGR